MTTSAQTPLSPAEAYRIGRQYQADGDLDMAKRHYGHVLASIPHHAEALTMLASIAYQQGDDLQGDAYIRRAIRIYLEVTQRMPENLTVRAPLVNLLLAQNLRAEAERQIAQLKLPLNPIRATPQKFVSRRREAIAKGLPPILINTLPKSASESIWNQLAEGLGLAQSHLSLGLFPDCCLVPARVESASGGGLIAKEHLPATAHNLGLLAQHGLTKVVFHVRDPRQSTLSWAHFVHDDVSMRLMAPVWRKIVPPADVLRAGLTELIDWSIDHYLPLSLEFMRGWLALRDDPDQPIDVLFLTFEQFRTEPERYFAQILDFYGLDPALFAADAGAEVVHLRRGLIEEWRDVFTQEQKAKAWKQIPSDLAEAYEWQP